MGAASPPPSVPILAEADNRPSARRRPRWHLLLDDPVPRTVLVVGEAPTGAEQWLAEIAASVRWIGTPQRIQRPADLVIVGHDVAPAVAEHDALRGLARGCGERGALWAPWGRSTRRDRALAAAGFSTRRWGEPGEATLSRRHPPEGVVACRSGPAGRPPTWLAALGRRVGWEPDGGSWTLRLPSAYPSQKAVALLRPGPRGGSAAVVKVTQDVRFNGRLENESRVLRALADRAPELASRRTPAVLGTAHVGGLAAVAEEALIGRPFLEASTLRPDCPLAADAAAAVTELGRAVTATAPGAALAHALIPLLERFVQLHRPPSAVARFLHAQIEAVAARSEVPTVLFHGDLGTWNLIVADGRVRILDWESAAAGAPPLWDLFYLCRSYAVRSGRRRGLPRSRAIGRHLIDGSPLTATFARWVGAHRQSLGIHPGLVEPLFHTCWMHRAVKEAGRLGADRSGHYGPLCVRLVEARRSPGLRLLLGTGPP